VHTPSGPEPSDSSRVSPQGPGGGSRREFARVANELRSLDVKDLADRASSAGTAQPETGQGGFQRLQNYVPGAGAGVFQLVDYWSTDVTVSLDKDTSVKGPPTPADQHAFVKAVLPAALRAVRQQGLPWDRAFWLIAKAAVETRWGKGAIGNNIFNVQLDLPKRVFPGTATTEHGPFTGAGSVDQRFFPPSGQYYKVVRTEPPSKTKPTPTVSSPSGVSVPTNATDPSIASDTRPSKSKVRDLANASPRYASLDEAFSMYFAFLTAKFPSQLTALKSGTFTGFAKAYSSSGFSQLANAAKVTNPEDRARLAATFGADAVKNANAVERTITGVYDAVLQITIERFKAERAGLERSGGSSARIAELAAGERTLLADMVPVPPAVPATGGR
jgi:hypothetical protein